MTDTWCYEPSTRKILDANGLTVAESVGPADAVRIVGGETCPFCEEGPFKCSEIEATWQQFQCPACGAWNDRAAPVGAAKVND